MSEGQRKELIEDFLQTERYLDGLEVRIIYEADDKFVIEFKKASRRVMHQLANTLRDNEMFHIRVTALEIVDFDNSKKGKKKHGTKRTS
jgi:hypothetical protein